VKQELITPITLEKQQLKFQENGENKGLTRNASQSAVSKNQVVKQDVREQKNGQTITGDVSAEVLSNVEHPQLSKKENGENKGAILSEPSKTSLTHSALSPSRIVELKTDSNGQNHGAPQLPQLLSQSSMSQANLAQLSAILSASQEGANKQENGENKGGKTATITQ